MQENLPVLLLQQLTILPYEEVKIDINVDSSKELIDLSDSTFNSKLLIISNIEEKEISPNINDLPKIGVISKIKRRMKLPNGNYRVTITGLNRVLIKKYTKEDEFLYALVKRLYIDDSNKNEEIAITRTLKTLVNNYMEINPNVSNSVKGTIDEINDLDMLTDIITNFIPFDINKKKTYMNEFDYVKRANDLIIDINAEIEVMSIESRINNDIMESFEKDQRDFLLRQKIAKLNEELGNSRDKSSEVFILNERIDELDIPEKTKKKLKNEVVKYSYTSETSPDSSGIRNYLDTVINLPWNIYSKDETDLRRIRKSLDSKHYGLEEAKMRILEFIAIKKQSKNLRSPIICLVGPPGTGKTTLGMSISEALNREFYKISVGGLNDASELTGHKRTYLGSSPGSIMQGIKKCGTSNPVFLIDEVDKMVRDYQGDPSAVLLDILDSNQNKMFTDFYIEEPFDLSGVLFILTANDINAIPSALRDRLEIIEISSYTEEEKVLIAKKHLLPVIFDEYNMKKVRIPEDVILHIINNYTKESGVRELDRKLRKILRSMIINNNTSKTLNKDDVRKILGPVKYDNIYERKNHIGTVSTLGVTSYGGVIMTFESIFIPGSGKIRLTGNCDESVKESASIALSYVLGKCKEFNISQRKIDSNDIHINALTYAVKKDGSSGGLAITTSIVSLMLDEEVPAGIGFTGEINLHGDILKVGRVKEKIIGAYNNNYKKVYIPKENYNDLEEIPIEIKNNLEIRCVENFSEVYKDLFDKKHK